MTRRLTISLVLALAASVVAVSGVGARTLPAPQPFRVLVVSHLTVGDLKRFDRRGAIGLLVPGVGPTTNRRRALASLVRGELENARLGGVPHGPVLIDVGSASGIPTGAPVIVVSLPPKGRLVLNDRRYPIAIVGDGYHGLLVSPTTRIPGLVSIVDVAATALHRPRGALSSAPAARPAEVVRKLDRQIAANDTVKLPALIVVAAAVLLLAVVRPSAALAGVAAALLGSIGLGAVGTTSIALLLVALALVTALGGFLLGRICTSETSLLVLCVLVLAVYLVAMAVEPTWVAVSPLGPTQNSRFYGIGNQLETLLLAPALAGAALAGRRLGISGYAVFALLALVTIADNGFGSDGGGAIVLGTAFALLAARLAGLRARGFFALLAVSAAVVVALLWFDFHQGGPDHLRSAFAHGLGGLLAVARNRVPLSYEPAFDQWYLVGPAALAFAIAASVVLRARHPRGRRDVLLSLVGAIVVSLLVNDSAAYVLIGGATALVALGGSPLPYAPLRRPQLARAPAPWREPAPQTARD